MKIIKNVGLSIMACIFLVPNTGINAAQNNANIKNLNISMFRADATTNADEYNDDISYEDAEEIADKMFEDLEKSDKLLKLPDGDFICGDGEWEIVDEANPDIVLESYNIETDPSSINVEEAKEVVVEQIMEEDNDTPQIGVLAAAPFSGTAKKIPADGRVYSNPFSGKGWRFSEKSYLPADGTGSYLWWSTVYDDGRVGNYTEAYATCYLAPVAGTPIYFNDSAYGRYISKGGKAMHYYTFNPISGSYYFVWNRM